MRFNLLEHFGVRGRKNGISGRMYAFYCNNCGSEIIGYDTEGMLAAEDVSLSGKINFDNCECPLCGEKLVRRSGYYMPDYLLFQLQYGRGGAFDKNKTLPSDEEFVSFYGEAPAVKQLRNIKMLRADIANEHYCEWEPLRPQEDSLAVLLKKDKAPDTWAPKFARMAEIREKIEQPREQAQLKAEAFAKSCDIPCDAIIANNFGCEIKADSTKLIEYLQNLIRLENGIYSLTQRLFSLYYQLNENRRYIVQCANLPFLEERKRAIRDPHILNKRWYRAHRAAPPAIEEPPMPRKPELKKPGLFNKKKILAENESLMMQYETDVQAYNALISQLKEEAKAKRDAVENACWKEYKAAEQLKSALAKKVADAFNKPSPANAIKAVLENETLEAEKLLANLYAARNKLYAYNVIFEKYRDPVAISSFTEYLISGRCTSLEGADGAYNIYENEIRMNLVITKLDSIIISLEQIKQNQFTLYTEMLKINTSLNTMNQTMSQALGSIRNIEVTAVSMDEQLKHISRNSDVIAHNTAVAAYYSKVNAELTNALGYMVALS